MQLKRVKTLRQGRDGEKAVGQYLERLCENGAKVFHDIPAKGFNLDHVVICKSGVYAIETKTFSKPDKGEAKFIVNRDAIFLNGKIENNKPVVVFPGWYIELYYCRCGLIDTYKLI